MSSQTTGIDTPPTLPTTYPFPFSDLYIKGYIQYAQNAPMPAGEVVDVNTAPKFWSRPIQAGENPTSIIATDGWEYQNGTWVFVPNAWVGTLAAAQAVNIPQAIEGPSSVGTEMIYNLAAIPVPAVNIPAGCTLSSPMPGTIPTEVNGPVSETETSAAGGDPLANSPIAHQILDGINTLLNQFGKPNAT